MRGAYAHPRPPGREEKEEKVSDDATEPRDCPHGIQWRRRFDMCAACMEEVLERWQEFVLREAAEAISAWLPDHGGSGNIGAWREFLPKEKR